MYKASRATYGPDIFEITSQWMAQLSDWHS